MTTGFSTGFNHWDEDDTTRRRNKKNYSEDEAEGLYNELERLRGIVDQMEGDDADGYISTGLNNSAMSTIFGLVLVVILVVTIYAFTNLFRALSKKFLE